MAIVLLLLGITVGALRLMVLHGIVGTAWLATLYIHHGELMIFGFLAPLILTERYVGSQTLKLPAPIHLLPYTATLGGAAKAASWLLGLPLLNVAGSVLVALAAALYLYLLHVLARHTAQAAPFRLMAVGGFMLLVSALLTLWHSPVQNMAMTLALLAFPILTILGERVELTRILAPALSRLAPLALVLSSVAFGLALVHVLLWRHPALLLTAALCLLAMAAPLAVGERPLYRRGGPPLKRYLARHLLVAYGWFIIGLITLAFYALAPSHSLFDAASHSLALGFVFTMILGHGPVIVPALLGRMVDAERLNPAPLVLLTAGNVLRIGGYLLREAGIYLPWAMGWSWLLTLLAIVVFGLTLKRSLAAQLPTASKTGP